MIEEQPNQNQFLEFQVKRWGEGPKKPDKWNHQPKRGHKVKKDLEKEQEEELRSGKQEGNVQQKRKQKIEDKIFKKLAEETNQAQEAGAESTQQVKIDKEVEAVCNILKYMLNQYNLDGPTEYANEEHTCQNWEVDEIIKQVSDTNLGDFIIKCPNPDNLPSDWLVRYNVVQDESGVLTSNYKDIRIGKALQYFYDLFDLDTNSQLESQREQVAFMLAFYFLKYKSNFDDQSDAAADSFLKVYDFYKMVEHKKLVEYMQLRQQQDMFEEKYEKFIRQMFKEEFVTLTCLNKQDEVLPQHEDMWKNLLRIMYLNLNTELIQSFLGCKLEEKNKDTFLEKSETDECRIILSKVKSISQLLKTFPDLMELVLEKLKTFDKYKDQLEKKEEELNYYEEKLRQKQKEKKEQNEKESKQNEDKMVGKSEVRLGQDIHKVDPGFDWGKRLLFWGQYLKKTIVGENVIWVNTKGRPNDVGTLLRFSLMYKLIIKSKLYLRTFLSRDECHLMLVIKANEEILENFAQKYKLNLEVDLGATDLFSFEPVDSYMRPLRLHKYVTDYEFMQKYNIKPDSDDKKQEGSQSAESEALNIYKKAQLMNEDELRTLVMTDQLTANKMLRYLRGLLEIDYIEQRPLENEYNRDSEDRQTWELYYVYNKLIITFIKRVKALKDATKKEGVNASYIKQFQGNVGMILRLMFLKAIQMCNEMYYEHREMRSVIPRDLSNFCDSENKENKLKNIWYYLGINQPSGFSQYYRIEKMQRLWRKFQINELKQRSKFFSAERLIIVNRVINQTINLSTSLDKKHIIDYYPLHDPFMLKSIAIEPYLSVIRKLRKAPKRPSDGLDASTINRLYSQYQCKRTISDFMKLSVQKQLELKCTQFKTFETSSIRYYCGQKIAFYFTLIKFLALQAWPLVLPALIVQVLLWVENNDIIAVGSSSLTSFNNILVLLWIFVNLFWTTHLIETWKQQQQTLAQQYGASSLKQNTMRRVKFVGDFKRDFETDEINFEYQSPSEFVMKMLFTNILNLAYVALVVEVLIMIFLFKTYLYQKGYAQAIVQQVPSILIAIATQIFTKIYTILIKYITNFENHKTVTSFENSLVAKASLISFVINFFSIFIYAYFSGYLSSSYLCQIRTTQTNVKMESCDYFLSSLLLSMIMVDFVTTFIGGFTPYVVFKIKEWLKQRSTKKVSKFNYNFFESIDNFYEEQDSMDSYMYTEELDNSWVGYNNITNVFAATALFAPALPLSYTMMFLTGIVRLHASKFDVIFLKRRILPTKTNSIQMWLDIIEFISYLSILTNVAYLVYTRNMFSKNQSKIFFLLIIIMFTVKYFMMAQYTSGTKAMAKRSDLKINDIFKSRRRNQFENTPEELNTDIENVIYDETKLNRKFHQVKAANVKEKQA